MANAKVINVTPGNAQIRLALADEGTLDGDTLSLVSGAVYNEIWNYTLLNKNIVIMSAGEEKAVIKMDVPAQISGGKRIKFLNVKFDATDSHSESWYEHLIYATDASDGNILVLEKCEFYNDALNNSTIYCASDKKLDSCIVTDCYFHNCDKSCLFFENTGMLGVIVSNSTFANITANNKSSYNAGIIDARTTAGKVRVDHCTFYNCDVMSTGYGAIRFVSSDALVSNSIFAMPESTDNLRAIHMPDGRVVKNCLTFNYTYDSKTGVRNGITKTDCIFGKSPVFKDAANADFTLCNASPARGKGTESSTMGDPRWVKSTTTVTIPGTLLPQDALFFSDSAGVAESDPRMVDFKVIGSHTYNNLEWVKWKFSVTEEAYYKFTANVTSTNGQKYNMYVLSEDETQIKGQKIGEDTYMSAGTTTFAIDEAIKLSPGNYIVKMMNPYSGSKGCVINIVAEYAGGSLIAVPDTLWPVDALKSEYAFVNEDGELRFTDDSHDGHVREQYGKWNISVAKAGNYKFTVSANSNNAHAYELTLRNSTETSDIASKVEKGSSNTPLKFALDVENLAIGNYVLNIRDTTKHSHGRIEYIAASYEGGAVVNAPGEILAADAVLLKEDGGTLKMIHRANGDIEYKANEQNLTEYALWNLHATEAGEMVITVNSPDGGHTLLFELYEGNTLKSSAEEETTTKWEHNYSLTQHLNIPAAGDYTLKLINKQQYSVGVIHSITIAPYVAPAGVTMTDTDTDNSAWVANVGGAAVDVQMTRTILGGMYNTICLPFSLNSTKCKALFGNDVELYTLGSATLCGDILNLQFDVASDIHKGTPVLIKTSTNIVDPLFEGVTIESATADHTKRGIVDFRGTFVSMDFNSGDQVLLLLSNNNLAYPQSNKTLKGFRAYFQISGGAASAPVVRGARIIAGEQVVTAIDLVETQNKTVQKVIENGQLIIIKDGVRYNVMGIQIQ